MIVNPARISIASKEAAKVIQSRRLAARMPTKAARAMPISRAVLMVTAGRIAITTVNGVDMALSAVSQELEKLPDDFAKYLVPTSGTYNCRTVGGSTVDGE